MPQGNYKTMILKKNGLNERRHLERSAKSGGQHFKETG